MADFPAARRVLLDAVEKRAFPAAVVEVGTVDGVTWREAFGTLDYTAESPPTHAGDLFDLASLTKVLATTPLVLQAVRAGVLALDDEVARRLPEWKAPDRRTVAVRDLLLHASGLPAWAPLYETCSTPAEYLAAIDRLHLEHPPRTASLYSDLGFIVLGVVVERALGRALNVAFEALADALAAGPIGFLPPPAWWSRTAPTQVDLWRGRLLRAEVDDRNAAALGGVAGHAGLFGSAGAVGQLARVWLAASTGGLAPPPFDHHKTVEEFVERGRVAGSSRALGWDMMLPTSSCGRCLSPRAFGHTGFTGTSLWIDPQPGVYVVLLTNRVHPLPANETIRTVRPALHDAVFQDLGLSGD